MLDALRQCLVFLEPGQRRRWLWLIPLAVTAATLEVAAAAIVLVLIQLISTPGSVSELPVLSALREYLPRSDAYFVAAFSLTAGVFYVAKNGIRLLEVYTRERCASDTSVAISARLLRGYLSAPYAFHLRRNSAELIRNVRSSVRIVCRTVLSSATVVVSESLVVLGIITVLVWSTPGVALAAGVVAAALMVLMLWLTQRYHTLLGKRFHDLGRAVLQNLTQSLGGIKEVKILGREEYFARSFAEVEGAFLRIDVYRGTLAVGPRLVVETLFICGVVVLIMLAQFTGELGQRLIPVLGFFVYAGFRILPSLHWIVHRLNEVRFGAPSIGEIHRDWLDFVINAAPSESGATGTPVTFTRQIVFEDVSYTYAGMDVPALQSVDLAIERGESIGIVGTTGAGKSTLIDLLLGLLSPSAGRITVDGHDIQQNLESWQRQLGYVPQTVYLTDDTIRRNIALGVGDEEIDGRRVRAATELAQADEFVDKLPAVLDTVVGERGVRLSGGQRQRVAVARALYNDPEVLVFDEATAALDNQTERELTQSIALLQQTKTVIIIAHRLTTVRDCDRLVFVHEGRVDDVGSFDDLLARNAEFRKMVQS